MTASRRRVLRALAIAPVAGAAGITPTRANAQATPVRLLVRREGDSGLTVLDLSDPAAPRVAARVELTGEVVGTPLVTRDSAALYWATRDGTVHRYDLARGVALAPVRVASKIADLAIASDGRHLAVAAVDPPALIVVDANLTVLRSLAGEDKDRRQRAPVLVVRDAPARRSFVASLPGLAELWEVSYDPGSADIPAGLIHDFQFREGAFVPGYLNARRTPLDAPLAWLEVDALGHEVLGGPSSGTGVHVVQLDVRRRIATLALDAGPRARRAAFWGPRERRSLAVADAASAGVAIFDATGWKPLGHALAGEPVRWVASHREARWIWVAVGPECAAARACAPSALHLIDKRDPGAAPRSPASVANRLRAGVEQVEFDAAARHAFALVAGTHAGVVVATADASREIGVVAIDGARGLIAPRG